MGNRVGILAVGALLGAAAVFGTAGTEAQMPSKRAFNGAVKPIGPYTPGVGVGNAVYLSGQIGLDPVSGQLVEGGTEAQAKRVMENLGAVLKEAGLGYGDVVKTTILHDRPGRVRQGQRHLRHLLPSGRRAAGPLDGADRGAAAGRANRDRLRRRSLSETA